MSKYRAAIVIAFLLPASAGLAASPSGEVDEALGRLRSSSGVEVRAERSRSTGAVTFLSAPGGVWVAGATPAARALNFLRLHGALFRAPAERR